MLSPNEHRCMVVLPGSFGSQTDESIFDQDLPHLRRLVEESNLTRVVEPTSEYLNTPELALVGLDPGRYKSAHGPLIVASLNVDPPSRSALFELTLASCDSDGVVRFPNDSYAPDELLEVQSHFHRLNSKRLTIVKGADRVNGLVWEDGSIDLETKSPSAADGNHLQCVKPEGDGDVLLRQLIDDSVNMLTNLDANKRRIDEERPPLNLLWPWGQGFKPELPNLPIRRGRPILFHSGSRRVMGVTRSVRYRHGNIGRYDMGIKTDLDGMFEVLVATSDTVIVFDSIGSLRQEGKLQEARWLLKRFDTSVLAGIVEAGRTRHIAFALSATGPECGLFAKWDSQERFAQPKPFDERSFGEKNLEREELWQLLERELS